ncbi:MAG: tetratricopeptide repeat protein [Blastocatellia bacterium]|nr:tetratricopeptide repeat protein [Blastocatellia bacterium]
MKAAVLVLMLLCHVRSDDERPLTPLPQVSLESVRALIERGELEEAARQLQEIRATHPRDPESARLLGEVRRRQGRWDEALAQYQAVLALIPRDVEAMFWIATLYRWKGAMEESLAAYGRVLAEVPQHVDALLGRARVFLQMGRLAEAEADVRAALAAAPRSEEAAELWLQMLLRARRFQEAEAWIRAHSDLPGRDRWLGDLYAAQGRMSEAIGAYARALAAMPHDHAVLRALAEAYRKSGKLERAVELYRQLARLYPHDADSYFWIGTIARWRGDVRAAEEAFREALRREPRHLDAVIGLVRLALAQEDLRLAERQLEQARALDPNHPEVIVLWGQLLERQGRRREALREYQRALHRDPQDEAASAGYWRLWPIVRPTFEATYEQHETEVLEGRADRVFDIPVTRIRYRLQRATARGRYPVGETWALQGILRASRDQVTNRSGGFTIYDFTILTPTFGVEGAPAPRWSFTGEIGAAFFQSNAAGSIPEETFLHSEAHLEYRGPSDHLGFGFRRGPFLGRSFAADVRFGIFVENRFQALYDRRLSSTLWAHADYAFARYSDGNRTHAAGATLRYADARKEGIIGYRLTPLQARFLTPENTLDFLRVHEAIFAGWWAPHAEIMLRAEAARAWYQDRNWGWRARAMVGYRPHILRVVEFGASYFRDWYARDALRYNTLTIRNVMPYLALRSEARPRWSYELRYGYARLSDEATARYWAHDALGRFAFWIGTRLRLGGEGRYWRDTLTQRTWHASIFLQWVF